MGEKTGFSHGCEVRTIPRIAMDGSAFVHQEKSVVGIPK